LRLGIVQPGADVRRHLAGAAELLEGRQNFLGGAALEWLAGWAASEWADAIPSSAARTNELTNSERFDAACYTCSIIES